MKTFKLYVKEIKEETYYGEVDKDAIKQGKVAFPVKLEINNKEEEFKKGDEVGYQYGQRAVIDGEEYVQVNSNSISWLK